MELCRTDLPGKPDIVLPKRRAVIFVHGCFWHRHRGCTYAYSPKTNRPFWRRKFFENVQRDRSVQRKLARLGWQVVVVWECELRDQAELTHRLRKLLAGERSTRHASHT
jgi:DNA mismatch endonuclease (patch repair protein)